MNTIEYKSYFFYDNTFDPNLLKDMNTANKILISIPPRNKTDLVLKNFKKNFKNYLLKRTKILNSKILMTGTTLQIKIWKELRKIPYGKTKSYGEIAAKVKTSPRYVGNVCGQNKHLVAIPCHRVIKGDGSLGGFSAPGGIKTKRKMLNIEGFKI